MRQNIIWLGLAIFFSVGAADNWSAEPQVRFNLLTLSSSRQADLRLAMPAHLNYQHAPLRMCVSQLAEHFQFSYWIDRRVDADKPLTLEVADGTLRECLTKLAQACDAEVGLIENVVTIARPEHLAAMQYSAVRLHNQLSVAQASNTQPNQTTSSSKNKNPDAQLRPLSWPMLTTPTELAQMICKSWELTLPIDLPHDLMNAGSLQPCTVSTQLALLFGGFDRCAAGGKLSELKLLAMPKPGSWQSDYPNALIASDRISSVKETFSDARIEKAGNGWTVAGPTAAHLQLLQPASTGGLGTSRGGQGSRAAQARNKSDKDPLSSQRFDITKQADKPLGAILKNLGEQLGLNIQWDPNLPPAAPHTLVTIEAHNSKLDEVLGNLALQAKLSITRDGNQISVRKK